MLPLVTVDYSDKKPITMMTLC